MAHTRTSTILRTSEIVSSIEATYQQNKPNSEKLTKDRIRLSILYGRGLKSIKKLKKQRRLQVSDEILDLEFKPSKSALESCHKKLFDSFELFELGVTAIETDRNSEDRYRTINELQSLLEFSLKLKLDITEVVSLADELQCLEGVGKDSKVFMLKFLPGLKRIADKNRNTIRVNRRKEKENCEAAKVERAEYTLATFNRDPLKGFKEDNDILYTALHKLKHAAKRKRDLEPQYFEKLCHSFLSGALTPDALRDFLRYNFDLHLNSLEGKAIVVHSDELASGSVALNWLLVQLKLLAMGKHCKLHPSSLKDPDGLSRPELKLLHQCYNEVDGNGDGLVEYNELKNYLTKMNFIVSEHTLEQLLHSADSDNDGFLSFDEFKHVIKEAEKLHASPLWLMLKEQFLKESHDNISSVASSSISSMRSMSSDSASKLKKRGHPNRRRLSIQDTISDMSTSSSILSVLKPTQSSQYHSIEDTSQHNFPQREFCDNCHAQDHIVNFCDKPCTYCFPPCGFLPTKCHKRCQVIPIPPLKKKSVLETIKLGVSKSTLPIAIPTVLGHQIIQRTGGSSTLIRALPPIAITRPASISEAKSVSSSITSDGQASSVFQGDIARYLQVGFTQLPLDEKGSKLKYHFRWIILYKLSTELKNRKIKMPVFMSKLRANALGVGKRATQKDEHAVPTKPELGIRDPLINYGIWFPRSALVDTLTELNISLDAKTRQTFCSSLDARKRGGIPTYELYALLIAADFMFCGKSKFEPNHETIPALIEIVVRGILEDLNSCFDLLSGAVNHELIDAIKVLKKRKALLDSAGVDSTFIEKVIHEKEYELKGKRLETSLPEGIVDSVIGLFCSSHDTEIRLLKQTEVMISQRAKTLALEQLSFSLVRPENLGNQSLPVEYPVQYLKERPFPELLHELKFSFSDILDKVFGRSLGVEDGVDSVNGLSQLSDDYT